MKKRNLFIGIALVAVILVALYLVNGRSISEGLAVSSGGTTYNVPDDVNAALKTIEQILNGTMKMDGTGAKDYEEYKTDFKDSTNKFYKSTDKATAITNPQVAVLGNTQSNPIYQVKLSYNDTIQVIYASAKAVASSTESTWLMGGTGLMSKIKPFIIIYAAFISKLNVAIKTVMNDMSNDDGKKLLLLILNKNIYTLTEEPSSTPLPVGAVQTGETKYNAGFEKTVNYIHSCFRRLYSPNSTSFNGKPEVEYFLCNYSENVAIPDGNTSLLIKNYINLYTNLKKLKSLMPIENGVDQNVPLFIELNTTFVLPTKDFYRKIFLAYTTIKSTISDDLDNKIKTYLQNPSNNSSSKPAWFSPQTISSASAPIMTYP
jgi:hypothetical protein